MDTMDISSSCLNNSMSIHHSLRESPAQIEVIAWSTRTGLFMTVDNQAIRMWSSDKQVKAYHRVTTDENAHTLKLKAFAAFALETSDDAFGILFASKRRSVRAGNLQIWNASLTLLHEVELECLPLSYFSISAMKSVMHLVDIDSNILTLNLEFKSVQVAKATPPAYAKQKGEIWSELKTDVTAFFTAIVQLIENDPENDDQILGITCLDEHNFAVLVVNSIITYSRLTEPALSVMTYNPTKQPRKRKIVQMENPNQFHKSHAFSIAQNDRIPCNVLCVNTQGSRLFAVGYFDGTVELIECDFEESSGKILGKLHVHDCVAANTERLYLDRCSWHSSPGYDFEVLSSGPDRKIKVIGCKRECSRSSSDKSFFKYDMEVIGDFYANPEPPSHVVKTEHRAKIREIITFALTSANGNNAPCRRRLAVPVGGMLLFIDFHLPHRLIWKSVKDSITSSGSVAAISPHTQSGSLSDSEIVLNGTLLVLLNGIVKLLDPITGKVLREFDTLHLHEAQDPHAVFDRIASPDKRSLIAKDNAINSIVKFREGRATAVYWCNKSQMIILGFSTGGIGFINTKIGNAHAETFKTHDASILQFLTFSRTIIINRSSESKDFLLAGDEKGVLSLWQFSSKNVLKVWSAEAHRGAIIYMQYVNVGSRQISPMIITACSAGFVKAWVQNADGGFMLSSYFKTSSHMSAFTSVSVTDNQNGLLQYCCSSGESLSLAAASTTSLNNVSASTGAQRALLVRVLCICGLSNGSVETWVLSSEKCAQLESALWNDNTHDSPILCLSEISQPDECTITILSAAAGGSVTIFELTPFGEKIRDLNYFSLPLDIKRVVTFQDAHSQRTCAVIGDQSIVEILPLCTISFASVIKKRFETSQNIVHEGLVEEAEYENVDENSNASIHESSSRITEFTAALSEEKPSFVDLENSLDMFSKVDSNQIAISLEYHFIRKDRRFIDLFLQNESNHDGYVSFEGAISIIHQWLNASSIGADAIRELMKLLQISNGDKLEFIKVAKVASIAKSAIKKKLQETSEYLASLSTWSDYYSLKKSRKSVNYNSVGEPVHLYLDFHKSIADGISNGDVEVLRAELSKQPSRAVVIPQTTKAPTALLRKLPINISKLVLKDIELPTTWDPAIPHWLDLRRTVRVARTLLDMRCMQQHELALALPSKRKQLKIQSISKLLAVYYERNFGSVRLNIASHKVVHYLEACLQYTQWPIIGIMQRFLCPKNSLDKFSECSLWILVELRKLLYSRGCVVDGETIPMINAMGDFEDKEDVNNILLKWQLVSRSDALGVVDEMFRIRGSFGITCVQKLLEVTSSMPPVSQSSQGDFLDLEHFLYSLIVEFNMIEHFVAELEDTVFGVNSIPNFKSAISRNITDNLQRKGAIQNTDRDAKISLSLDRIRALTQQFVYNDPGRNGTIDEITFRSIVVIAGQAILGFECGRDAHKLVDVCIRQFKGGNPDSDICYLDFWASLLAYLPEFQGGEQGLNGLEAFNAVTASRRGLDEKQASALVILIQYMQCPKRDSFTWTTGLRNSNNSMDNRNIISRSGQWNREVSVPEDVPGVLSVKELKSNATINIVPPRVQIRMHVNAAQSSYIPQTNRAITTLSGEISKPDKTITRIMDKAPLYVADLSVGAFSGPDESQKYSVGERKSYSRSLSVESLDDYPLNADRKMSQSSADSELYNELEFAQSYGESELSETGAPSSFETNQLPLSSAPYLMGLFHDAASQSLESAVSANISLVALDGMERRRLQLITEEQELLRKQEAENFMCSQRLNMRKLHQKKARREHRCKEKESMEYKAREDFERAERKRRGRESYEKALKAQQDDQRRAANVAMERLLEEKMRARRIKAERDAKEHEEAEKRKELDERLLMRKEEHLSIEVEAMIAEKLRIEKENAERAAAEAAKKAADERERLRVEEEAQRAKEEKERAAAEVAMALRESLLMLQQDLNVLLIPEPEPEPDPEPVTEEEMPNPDDQEVAEETVDEPELEPTDGLKVPWLMGRMISLVEKLKATNQRHLNHPRWSTKGGEYFMPQMFSEDITFNPFESSADNQEEALKSWDPTHIGQTKIKNDNANESAVSGSFDDIADSVKAHKLLLIRQRLEQLYQTSSSEASPADWTEIFRVAVVDWGTFFHDQEDILYERPPTPPAPVDEDANFLSRMASISQEKPVSKSMSVCCNIPESLLTTYDQTAPEPLPFGTVARNEVYPNSYRYYQVEVVDPDAIVTFELMVEHGFAELLVLDHELPTVTNYSHRAKAELFNKKIARIRFSQRRDKSFFIGVHSQYGAKFQLWAFSSGLPDANSTAIHHVSKCLREFELLSNQPLEYLHVKLPSLVEQAKRIVEFENTMAKPSILTDLQSAIQSGSYCPSNEKEDDLDEIEIMDRFISKAGRRLMRKDLRDFENGEVQGHTLPKIANNTDDEDDSTLELNNPNDHIELFPKPRLSTRDSFMELVDQGQTLKERESTKFVMLSIAQRKALKSSKLHNDVVGGSPVKKLTSIAKLPLLPIKYSLSSTRGNHK